MLPLGGAAVGAFVGAFVGALVGAFVGASVFGVGGNVTGGRTIDPSKGTFPNE